MPLFVDFFLYPCYLYLHFLKFAISLYKYGIISLAFSTMYVLHELQVKIFSSCGLQMLSTRTTTNTCVSHLNKTSFVYIVLRIKTIIILITIGNISWLECIGLKQGTHSIQHYHQSRQQRPSESLLPGTTFLPVLVEQFHQTPHLHHILL